MMKYRQLGHTGLKLSVLGMGGSGFGNVYGNHLEEEATKAVHQSLRRGVNYFDTAYWYGQGKSEKFLGRALKNVSRDKFYIGTKIGRYERDVTNMFDFSARKVIQSAKDSLDRLQMNYVDILQVHDVEFAPSIDMLVNETLPALEEVRQSGLCHFIGITGYSLSTLQDVILSSKVKIDSVLTYCRLTLNDSTLLKSLELFRDMGVPIINASPLSMGLLSPKGFPIWHPASQEIKQACKCAVAYCRKRDVDITKLALKYSSTCEEVSALYYYSKPVAVLYCLSQYTDCYNSCEHER